MLQTSILNRLTGSLCDAVTGQSDGSTELTASGQATLERLEEANLFLVPLDHERRWYRYHHFFADLLCNQLDASQPDLVPTLHRRASAWYAQNDLIPEAIAHSLAAKDLEQVVQLIDKAFLVCIIHGKGTGTLRRAVREQLEGHPLVASYRPGDQHEGSDGATVVELVSR